MIAQAKICGLKTVDATRAALDRGAAFIGLNHFPNSPRFIAPGDALLLRGLAKGRALVASVVVDPSDALVVEVLDVLEPDFIQLHGAETPARVAEIAVRARAKGIGVIKAFGVSSRGDVAASAAYADVADLFLFDAKPPPGALMTGGHGVAYDWSILKAAQPAKPWMLAGGLNAGNVRAAVAASGAGIVDVSSGVESEPGLKDPSLIAAFLAALRTDASA